MKKIITTCIFAVLFLLPSCLDVDPPGRYGDDQVWESSRNLDFNIKSFYYDVLHHGYVSEISSPSILTDAFGDLLKYTRYQDGNSANRFFSTTNFMSEENTLSPWSDWYTRIKKLNDFLIAVNEGNGNKLDPEELNQRVGEVRFLRAFLYQDLTIRHGGVVLRVNETRLDGPDEAQKARSTKEECWDFIIDEYEKSAGLLPENWSEYGRLTKGAAWGMMARAALYAGRWDKAIEAAGKVEELAADGYYELLEDYGKIFTVPDNKELIIPVYYSLNNGHAFDQTACPSGDQSVFGTIYIGGLVSPTDEFAGSYDIKVNGIWRTFNWDDVKNGSIADPWADRDIRFYHTILHNGAEWRGRELELYVNGADGFLQYSETGNESMRKSVTGYVIRKFLSTDVDYQSVNKSKEYWIEMRYAEILLILSEAHARKGDMSAAYEYLNKIRRRAQLSDLSQKPNWEGYLNDLQKERICELGLEGHRFWDLRRWGIATDVLNGSRTHGIKITKNGNNFSYERVDADEKDRVFPEKYNIFPIPSTEVRRNILCTQDDIWKNS
ncbi:MAG: RagB/SusD family nutrient uptake outer membrane protein [Tannerella sp.]|nr:RagB/SusD family nutrient uptake outer membrane protein [Tannerella sp.]